MRGSARVRAGLIIGGVDEAADRLATMYRGAGPTVRRVGAEWYREARREIRYLAESSGYPADLVAGVVAVLSPRCLWARNIPAAAAMLDRPQSSPYGPTGANMAKVRRMLAAYGMGLPWHRLVRGPKVSKFYHTILPYCPYPRAAVCDVWTMRAAAGRLLTESEAKCLSDAPGYAVVEAAVLKAADMVGVAPHVLQATVWIVVRGDHR